MLTFHNLYLNPPFMCRPGFLVGRRDVEEMSRSQMTDKAESEFESMSRLRHGILLGKGRILFCRKWVRVCHWAGRDKKE